MASITAIQRRHENVTYRVRIRIRNKEVFTIGFDDKDAAQEWVSANEDDVLQDPERYVKWRHSLFYEMQLKGVDSLDHIRKPKPARKSI
jgi:hypothetical protein